MPLDIDPTVDYAFKRLFADPANEDLLLHLLNAVLGRSPPIVDVVILNPFNEKEFAADKLSVLDIKARSADGAWYNIEIQSRAHWSLRPRLAYYAASLYVEQLTDGEVYTALTPHSTARPITAP
jgi:predicted transposase/invertase (TIGR01784 family)